MTYRRILNDRKSKAVFDDITIMINEERGDDLGEFPDLSEYN